MGSRRTAAPTRLLLVDDHATVLRAVLVAPHHDVVSMGGAGSPNEP